MQEPVVQAMSSPEPEPEPEPEYHVHQNYMAASGGFRDEHEGSDLCAI